MLIPNLLGFVQRLVLSAHTKLVNFYVIVRIKYVDLRIVDFLENIFEATIVLFQDSIFGAEIERIFSLQSVLQRRMSKIPFIKLNKLVLAFEFEFAPNNYLMESSVLYIPIVTPAPLKSLTICTMLVDPSAAVHFISNWPAPGIKKSVALYC
jgi:hypothetical protein